MTVKERFETMDYGPAPEDAGPVMDWLEDGKRRFGHFVGGALTNPTKGFASRNPANGSTLATLSQARKADVGGGGCSGARGAARLGRSGRAWTGAIPLRAGTCVAEEFTEIRGAGKPR